MSNRTIEAALGAGICALAIGVFLWGIPIWVEPNDFAAVPPDLLPRVAVAVIAVLSAMMALHRLFLSRDEEPAGVDAPILAMGGLLVMVFGVAAWMIPHVGYLVGGLALVAVLMIFMGARNPWIIIATSAAAPLFLFGLFDRLLGIPLP